MNKNLNKKGFTIIEVVLVLAIAGLIFLMVFVALPRLQISQRDTQRRDDVAAVATALTQYQSNNGGKLPTQANKNNFETQYLKSGGTDWADPNGNNYTLDIVTYNASKASIDAVQQNSHDITYEIRTDSNNNKYCGLTYDGQEDTSSTYQAGPPEKCTPEAKTVTDNESGVFTSNIYIITGAACGEDGALVEGKGASSFAVGMRLEGAGYYCTDN